MFERLANWITCFWNPCDITVKKQLQTFASSYHPWIHAKLNLRNYKSLLLPIIHGNITIKYCPSQNLNDRRK